jgi:hypothetical protein
VVPTLEPIKFEKLEDFKSLLSKVGQLVPPRHGVVGRQRDRVVGLCRLNQVDP